MLLIVFTVRRLIRLTLLRANWMIIRSALHAINVIRISMLPSSHLNGLLTRLLIRHYRRNVTATINRVLAVTSECKYSPTITSTRSRRISTLLMYLLRYLRDAALVILTVDSSSSDLTSLHLYRQIRDRIRNLASINTLNNSRP